MNRLLLRHSQTLACFLALTPALVSGSSAADAQTHKVAKTEDIIRAVGVYEWTGDMQKPNANRLIPVSLFINSKLEDAGIYNARPVPFALISGNVYELDQAGVSQGLLSLETSRHLQAAENATTTFDDGWFGYGNFIPPPPPPKVTALKPSRNAPVLTSSKSDDGKPHFGSKPATSDADASGTPPPIKDETPAASTPAGDPDRPTMRRRADSSDQTASANPNATKSSDAPDTPSDDPDRPTLRRRPTDDPNAKKPTKSGRDESGVTGLATSLNDDPNRPTLKHGKPSNLAGQLQSAQLAGVPEDLHQMVAISDPVIRPVHDFTRAWDNDAQRADILAKMQTAARAQLIAYQAAPAPAAKIAKPTPTRHTANSKLRLPADANAETPIPLLDEQLKGFLLSYGGAPTYVYTAHTAGEGAALRYVTIVAQVDMQSNALVALKSVTDVTHLDRTPRMRFVDAVDAEASNRASLLFELRGDTSRQFALYRVIGARAEQTFITGTTQ